MSILDQYEQASINHRNDSQDDDSDTEEVELITDAAVDIDADDDEIRLSSMLRIRRVQSIVLRSQQRIQYIAIGAGKVVLTTMNGYLYFFNTPRSHIQYSTEDKYYKEVDTKKIINNAGSIKNVFFDPVNGNHLFLSLASGTSPVNSPSNISNVDLFYLNTNITSSSKFKQVLKIRGNEITAVGWNRIILSDGRMSRMNTTGPILLGTSKGIIFEMEISTNVNPDSPNRIFHDSFAENYCRQVFDIGKSSNPSATSSVDVVTGIEFYNFINSPERFFILITTANRLYQFISASSPVSKSSILEERPLLLHVFNNYLIKPEGFLEIPLTKTVHANSSLMSSRLQIYFESDNDGCKSSSGFAVAVSFGWLVHGEGVVYGELQTEWNEEMSSSSHGNVFGSVGSLSTKNRILEFEGPPWPLSFVITKYHCVLLYSDRIKGICVLNKKSFDLLHPSNESFSDENNGKYVSMMISKEDNGDAIWIGAERAVLKGRLHKEDRHIWKVYLQMEDFSLAKLHCIDNLRQYHHVLRKEADYYFDKKEYEKSAQLYSEMSDDARFEEITIKFLQVEQIEALQLYLLKALEKLKVEENAQISMLTLWLIELFEQQFNKIKLTHPYDETELNRKQRQFEGFLSMNAAVSNCVKINKETVYRLLNSHGDHYNFLRIARLNNHLEPLIAHHLQSSDSGAALGVLYDAYKPDYIDDTEFTETKQLNLLTAFLPELLWASPKSTVDFLITVGYKVVNPVSILPCLIFPYDNTQQAFEVIRYMEYCVLSAHLQSEALHNYLIALYAKYKPNQMLQYLATQGQEFSMINYDVSFALKLCQEGGVPLAEACVQLYSLLELWEDAVDLALQINLDLAKQTAALSPVNNPELCKKLWLKIARHVVNEKNDIGEAMQFIALCGAGSDILKIEDVLPFFSDFVTIDHFKDAICSSLQQYNENIENLKEEMDDATNSANLIRDEIRSFKNRYNTIEWKDVCCSCSIQLLVRPFYIFPACGHRFHTDCLIREMKPFLTDQQNQLIENLQRQLSTKQDTTSPESNSSTSIATNSDAGIEGTTNIREQLKKQLDGVIATDCFFCGPIAIEQIDRPFIEEEEFERICLDWQ